MKPSFNLWLAQGFGSGRFPKAPGTMGSLVGLAWFLLLLLPGSWYVLGGGILASCILSVWSCGRAEAELGRRDPGSVVLDEIVAIPLCFVGWMALVGPACPAPSYFFRSDTWYWTLAVFGLFRLFDIAKPWPVRQSQALRGGLGVTMDDLLAAGYVNLVVLVAALWLSPPPVSAQPHAATPHAATAPLTAAAPAITRPAATNSHRTTAAPPSTRASPTPRPGSR